MRFSASNGACTLTSLSKYTYTSRPSFAHARMRRAQLASARSV
jgi:hypothetical protein